MEKYQKKCDCCGKPFNAGFLDAGSEWCSMKCLIKENQKDIPSYSKSDWEKDCEISPDVCYYTEWEEIDEDEWYNKDGVLFRTDTEQLLYERLNACHSAIDSFSDFQKELGIDNQESESYLALIGELAENESLLKKIEDGK